MKTYLNKNLLHITLFLSFFGFAISLSLSEILDLPPCDLCWYQRVLMFPLWWIIFVCIKYKIKIIHMFVLPFTILGMLTSGYHYLLQKQIFFQSANCSLDVPCTTELLNVFGFITIPFLTYLLFTTLTLIFFYYKNKII